MYTYSNFELAMMASRCIDAKELSDLLWVIIELYEEHDRLLNAEFATKMFVKRINYLTKNV